MDEAEYRERYRTRILAAGCPVHIANDATDAAEPNDEDLANGDPEGDAENEMSYWDSDEGKE